MKIKELRIREEAETLRFEPAVDLASVIKGEAPTFISDPAAFFERTYLTSNIKSLIIKSLMSILGLKTASVGGKRYEVTSNLIVLPSEFGGGKTHSLILLYHVFSLINKSRSREEIVSKLRILDSDIAEFVSEYWGELKSKPIKVVVIDCKVSDLAPSPAKPVRIAGREIRTLWGYLGYELGRYEYVAEADSRGIAPYVDDLFKVVNESRALVLIDEIGRYYDVSGLPPTIISTFLMNLAEALSKYTVREVAIIISLPYEVMEKEVEEAEAMKYVHREELVQAINKVLSRPNIEIIKPVERRDLAEILRKRIFTHNRKEFEKFAEDFIAKELNKEYPLQVRRVLDERGFWRHVKETYPFHPMFLEVLEKLAYRLPYLQRTRDAIRLAVLAVLAIREGLFNWLENEVDLIMPYHIPIFINEILTDILLRNAPNEYRIFSLILKENILIPHNYDDLKEMSMNAFYERVVAQSLRSLKREDLGLAIKLASIIWLHSLVGLGLPINIGVYPRTIDLVYSVAPTELDVKGILSKIRVLLPQLVVHGDSESDSARWFFANVPSIEELIETFRRNVTDAMAKNALAELLEAGLGGRRGRGRPPKGFRAESEVFEQYSIVRSAREIQREVLESKNPAVVIFVDKVCKNDLVEILRGRNNIVVLAPYIEGYVEPEPLPPEDIKGISELSRLNIRDSWRGLIEILKYYVVVSEYITDEHLKRFAFEKIGGEELAEDILNMLRSKVSGKKAYYYRHAWNLINRVYQKVYYFRLGDLRYEEGLSLESDKPLLPIIEIFLREKGLIPETFSGDDLLSLIRDYLGKDPEKEPLNVGAVWQYIRTTDKANVPIISYKMFVEAVKDLIRSLNYAVKVGEVLLWKPIYRDRSEAEGADDGEVLLRNVENVLRRKRESWDRIELIHYMNAFDEWKERILRDLPRDKVIKVKRVKGDVVDLRDVLKSPDPRSEVKAGKLFYERKKYIVDMDLDIPSELWEGREYRGTLKVAVEGFKDEIKVEMDVGGDLLVEPMEFEGKPPLSLNFTITTSRPGDYELRVKVYGRGELLESRSFPISVLGEWMEYNVVVDDKGQPIRESDGRPIKENVKVVYTETSNIQSISDITRILEKYGGRVEGRVKLERGEESIVLSISCSDPTILKLITSSLVALTRLPELKVTANVKTSFLTGKEPELGDIMRSLANPRLFKFKVKERVAGG